jgi:formylglycine-generating enzyme required for sulfatase activity
MLGGAALLVVNRRVAQKPSLPTPVSIPAGRYLIGKGTPTNLPAFWIDKTEVSFGQYARFLIWIERNPESATKFDHPEQPRDYTHTPADWKNSVTELIKEKGAKAHDPQLDLPVTGVSWWDAFAFAKWAGRELPTQEEWEAAARGSKGLLYPWGDEADFLKATVKAGGNSPAQKPADVSTQPDVSPFGVAGMAGNVAEWTATRPKENQAIVKGGHFASTLLKLDSAVIADLTTRKSHIGFRTISHTPPKP